MRNVHTSFAGYDSNMQQQGQQQGQRQHEPPQQQREEGGGNGGGNGDGGDGNGDEEGAFDDYPVVARLLIDRTFRLIQSAASHDTIEKVSLR